MSIRLCSTNKSMPLVLLLAAASATLAVLITFGNSTQGSKAGPQAFDAARQILFVAHPGNGAVRVLNLRNTVGEIGTLRTPARHQVLDLRLDASRRWLWVLGDDAVYRYDAHSLKPAGSYPLLSSKPQEFSCVDQWRYVLRELSKPSMPNA